MADDEPASLKWLALKTYKIFISRLKYTPARTPLFIMFTNFNLQFHIHPTPGNAAPLFTEKIKF
jgi:hypothetical protein